MPAIAAVVAPQRILDLVALATAHGLRPGLHGPRQAIVGVHFAPAVVAAFAGRQAGVLVPAPVEVIDLAVGGGGEHDLRHRVGQLAQARLAARQVRLRAGTLHRLPAARRHQPYQFDLRRGPHPRLQLVHADRGDQAAGLVQRRAQQRAGAHATVAGVVEAHRRHVRLGVLHHPRPVLAHALQQVAAEIAEAEAAGHVRGAVDVVGADLERVLVGIDDRIRAAAGMQVPAEQDGAGLADGLGAVQVLQRVLEHQQEAVVGLRAGLLGAVDAVHQYAGDFAFGVAHRLVHAFQRGLGNRFVRRAAQVEGHRLASEGQAAGAHVVEQADETLLLDLRDRLGQWLADHFARPDQLLVVLIDAFDHVVRAAQDRQRRRRLLERVGHLHALRVQRPQQYVALAFQLDLRGVLGAHAQHAADAAAVVKDRAVGKGEIHLFAVAVAQHHERHMLVPGRLAGRQHVLGLAGDRRPHIGPHLGHLASERERVAHPQDRDVGVVVEIDHPRAPADHHREARTQAERQRRAQALRPVLDRPQRVA